MSDAIATRSATASGCKEASVPSDNLHAHERRERVSMPDLNRVVWDASVERRPKEGRGVRCLARLTACA